MSPSTVNDVSQRQKPDENESEEESMSLKEVIMTLNEFYSVKLENVHKLVSFVKAPQ